MRTTLELAQEVEDSVNRNLDQLQRTHGIKATCDVILEGLTAARDGTGEFDLLERFFKIIWIFQHAVVSQSLSNKTCSELTRTAEYCLQILNIKPYSSKLSYLYSRLHEARSKMFADTQNWWTAAWSLTVADAMDGTEAKKSLVEQYQRLLQQAAYYYHSGYISESLALYQKAEPYAVDDLAVIRVRLGIIRCLRILNEYETAQKLIQVLRELFTIPDNLLSELSWEEMFLISQRDQDMSHLLRSILSQSRKPELIHTEYFLLANLWCYASKQRAAIGELPGASWLKRNLDLNAESKNSYLTLKLIQYLEDCYSTKTSIFNKLNELGERLVTLRAEPSTEENVVFFAAVARWLLRVKQKPSAALVISEYQSRSLMLSQGRSNDVFALLGDVGESLNAIADTSRSLVSDGGIKTGLERTFLYVEILAKLFVSAVIAKSKSLLPSDSSQDWQRDVLIKLSKFFVKYASGSMKGPIHKLGQILMNMLNLPPEAEENFKSILWSPNIVRDKIMARILEEELGSKWQDIFVQFDWEPIGVGSVSQVYRARLKSGEEVAVKIQYPDLDKVVEQDLNMFSRILSAARWLFPSVDLQAIDQLVKKIYLQEIDFTNELAITQKVARLSEPKFGWRVPKFYPQYCRKRVLVSEFVEGKNLYNFTETSSQQERLRVAETVHRFSVLCILEGGITCLDPHPANLIVATDSVYMIDFGCFVSLSDEFLALYRELLSSYVETPKRRLDAQIAAYRRAGILRQSTDVAESDVREFLSLIISQLNWEACAKPGLQARFNELFIRRGVNKIFGSKHPEFVLAFISQLLTIRTIHKFSVPRSEDAIVEGAISILERYNGDKKDQEDKNSDQYLEVS